RKVVARHAFPGIPGRIDALLPELSEPGQPVRVLGPELLQHHGISDAVDGPAFRRTQTSGCRHVRSDRRGQRPLPRSDDRTAGRLAVDSRQLRHIAFLLLQSQRRTFAAASDVHLDSNRRGVELPAERLRHRLRRSMSRRSNRVARFSGLALAGAGVAHFTSPGLFETITKAAFPRNPRQHVYTNGSIETVLGLGFASRQTRSLGTVGLIGYLAYLGGNAIRQSKKP